MVKINKKFIIIRRRSIKKTEETGMQRNKSKRERKQEKLIPLQETI